ncbi:SAM-dependent methyltransferase [Streptomyces sp. NPDC021080]|uniref:SAM-dependent methyltransferase n=1 Tax=Streptomyces sp. NPDC021080 TaxID=3365110 RepID=UPI0037A353A9
MERAATGEWRGWREATEEALYGPSGFYRRPEGPAGHFRTSVHASPLFAGAVARLLCRLDTALGRPDPLAFVDMGAGRGELVTAVLAALPAEVAGRTRAYAVERADRPAGLDPRISWLTEPPRGVTGLLFANEWLDNVPVDVAEAGRDAVPRLVLVRGDGTERLGEPVAGEDARWLRTWWWPRSGPRPAPGAGQGPAHGRKAPGPHGAGPDPTPAQEAPHPQEAGSDPVPAHEAPRPHGARPGPLPVQEAPRPPGAGAAAGEPLAPAEGARAEIGLPRDRAWAFAVSTLDRGLAVAVDYAHFADGRPPFGTLTGFREGRGTAPVPDGSCDITAHVALDACTLPGGRVVTQRAALRALGVSGARPPLSLASTDPAAYVRALAGAGQAAELTAPGGLGDFGWLLQPVGFPDGLRDSADAVLRDALLLGVPGREGLLVDVPDHEEQ